MESLAGTSWDVVIEGTGLQQSLLALALSRSDKKVLHVDGNNYYGGPEAAFSLQEAESWAESLTATPSAPFSNVSWRKPETSESSPKKLSPSRAYTLTLSPQIIYAKSKLVSQLVSSQVYRQLEFQAVGNWWLYENTSVTSPDAHEAGTLKRMPNGREDIFSDRSIDVRAKRGLMKFIKFVVDFENQAAIWETHADTPFVEFLASQFQLPPSMQTYLVALTLSLAPATVTSVGYALPRIARHLTSIGVFGPGFGAVVPKWGGGAEIAQVACRALAVGGGVYVLGTGISGADTSSTDVSLKLTNDESVQAGYYISSQDKMKEINSDAPAVSKMVTVVSSDLSSLFVSTLEGAPLAAVAVVAFPADAVAVDGRSSPHPIFIMVHSSDSGECPQGQYVLYASTTNIQNPKGRLEAAVSKLLKSADAPRADAEGSEQDAVLFEMYYEQSRSSTSNLTSETSAAFPLEYHPKKDVVSKFLIERGRRFEGLKGCHYMEYTGVGLGETIRCGRAQYSIKGRVMCDKATYNRINPDRGIMIVPLPGQAPQSEDGENLFMKNNCELPTTKPLTDEQCLLASFLISGFALSEKKWVDFYIDNLSPIQWNENAFDQLVLPPSQKSLVRALVESHVRDLDGFDDIIKGKGKGFISILHGPPGVGKTLTAESVAEHTRRPLYAVSSGELGVNPKDLEDNLSRILDVATQWKAVLLLDEADVFLETRSLHDLTRNSLVSIFLRLLEYYQGILFLTSNRVTTFDEAFQSRIHVALKYNKLDRDARMQVWKNFMNFDDLKGGKELLESVIDRELNGRQIKNCVRTARSLAESEGKRVDLSHLMVVLDIQQRFENDFGGLITGAVTNGISDTSNGKM